MSVTSEIKQNSITNLNLSSESFKIDGWQEGYKYFDYSLIDHQNRVYGQLWVDRGRPEGDLQYGEHAFRCNHDQWATNQEKAKAIDALVERLIEEICEEADRTTVEDNRLAVNGYHVDSMSRVINRIATRLNHNPQGIERGIHMAEFVGSVFPRVMRHFSVVVESVPRFFHQIGNFFSSMERFSNNMGRLSHLAERSHRIVHRTNDLFSVGERIINIAKSHKSDAQQRAHDKAAENLGRLKEVGGDLAKAAGWGAHGDIGQAMESAAEAGAKLGQMFLEGLPGVRKD